MQPSEVLLVDGEIAIIFPYVPEQVAAIKRVPGARWDRLARVWRAPITSLGPVRDFATTYNFQIDPALTSFTVPEHPIGKPRIEQGRTLLHIYFPYDPVKVKAVKKLPGAAWDKNNTRWTVPKSSTSQALDFAQEYGLHVEDLTELTELQTQETERQHHLAELSRATEHDLPDPAGLALPLDPAQKAAVQYVSETKQCFIADEMGIGKTVEAIASLEHLHEQGHTVYPALVVVPPTLTLNWEKEINRFLPHRTVNVVRNRKGLPDTHADFLVMGWSNIHTYQKDLVKFKQLKRKKKPIGVNGIASLILDESHMGKNKEAKRTQAAIAVAAGLRAESPDAATILLTGTPIASRPAEYAAQLDILGTLGEFGGYWPFYKRYAAAFQDRFGQWHKDGASNLEELNYRLRSTCFIRRLKIDVMSELDEPHHFPLYVEPDPKVYREYKEAKEDIAAFLALRAAEIARELGANPRSAAVRARIRAEANEHLVRITTLKRIAAMSKLPAVYEWVDSRVEEGSKVVVAAHHRDVVDAIADKYGGLKVQGGMKTFEVEEAKRRFQEWSAEEAPVITISIMAAGLGHTLTAAQNVLLVEQPWTPVDVDQVVARLHRRGQQGLVTATHMLADRTIDLDIYEMIQDKRRVVGAATDGGDVGGGSVLGDLVARLAGFDLTDAA